MFFELSIRNVNVGGFNDGVPSKMAVELKS
jgi:hypothetical protein